MKNMMLMASAAAFHLKLKEKIWLLATLFLLNIPTLLNSGVDTDLNNVVDIPLTNGC